MKEKVKDNPKKIYRYAGAVMIFDRVVATKFEAETRASSLAKARNNIAWQFRQKGNVADHIPVTLLGEIVTP